MTFLTCFDIHGNDSIERYTRYPILFTNHPATHYASMQCIIQDIRLLTDDTGLIIQLNPLTMVHHRDQHRV